MKNQNKRKILTEYGMIVSIILIIIISFLADLCFFPLPEFILLKIDNSFYQVLFSAQASASAIGLAIIALLSNAVDKKIYGMSVSRFIMRLNHIIPFSHSFIICTVILLLAFNGVAVGLGLFNLSVSLFFTTIFLFIMLALDVIKVMYLGQQLENEIKEHIITSNKIEYIENVFIFSQRANMKK